MSVISIGTFDGLHLGHRKLLQRITHLAKELGLSSVVITYRDHPAFTLNATAPPRMLCPASIKQKEMQRLGIQHVELLEFTPQLAATSAMDFLRNYIIEKWHPKYIVVGYDSHFGAGRQGNRAFLEAHSAEYGYQIDFVEPLLYKERPVSSRLIRELLQYGDLQLANELLGRPYSLSGKVVAGISRGRGFGFPTANLGLDNIHQLIPADGIYFSRVHISAGVFFGLTNIGKSPTVKHTGLTEIETYILGFDGDLYDAEMHVDLLKYLREEKLFANTEELVLAMQGDLAIAKRLIGEYS